LNTLHRFPAVAGNSGRDAVLVLVGLIGAIILLASCGMH
jgi:hypothetical protein